VYEMTH